MTFAMWWAENYRTGEEVPEQYFNMMRDAYERGKTDEREACAKLCDEFSDAAWNRYKKMYYPHDEGQSDGAAACAMDIRARSNAELRGDE